MRKFMRFKLVRFLWRWTPLGVFAVLSLIYGGWVNGFAFGVFLSMGVIDFNDWFIPWLSSKRGKDKGKPKLPLFTSGDPALGNEVERLFGGAYQVLSDVDIERLAAEAEQGYEIEHLLEKKSEE